MASEYREGLMVDGCWWCMMKMSGGDKWWVPPTIGKPGSSGVPPLVDGVDDAAFCEFAVSWADGKSKLFPPVVSEDISMFAYLRTCCSCKDFVSTFSHFGFPWILSISDHVSFQRASTVHKHGGRQVNQWLGACNCDDALSDCAVPDVSYVQWYCWWTSKRGPSSSCLVLWMTISIIAWLFAIIPSRQPWSIMNVQTDE